MDAEESRDAVLCGRWEQYPREFAKSRRCHTAKYCGKALRGVKVTNSEFWCSTRDTDEGGGERTERDIMDPILHINFKLWTKLAICGLFLMGTMRLRLGSAQALLLKFHQSRESGEEREGKGEEFAGAWPRYCSTTTLGPGAHD